MVAVGSRNASRQCAWPSRAVLCCAALFGVFSHAPAKIPMGKVGLRHKAGATRQVPHKLQYDEGALTCLALISRAAARSQPQMTLPAVSSGTHPSSPADSSTQDTSPQNRPPRVETLHCDHVASY